MFLQQTFVAMGRALPAVIAPAIITDLRLDAYWVGIYFALTAASSLVCLARLTVAWSIDQAIPKMRTPPAILSDATLMEKKPSTASPAV